MPGWRSRPAVRGPGCHSASQSHHATTSTTVTTPPVMWTENTPSKRDHRQRDAVTVPQCRGDQHHGRHGHAVGGEVGHRRRVELHIRDGGERRGQGARCGGGARGAPLVRAGAQQIPREHRCADGEQPHRRGERVQRVHRRGRRTRELRLDRGQRVERRRVVERVVRLDVAKVAHVRGRRLSGIEDEPHGVGVPDRIPGARNRLPMRYPTHCCESDQQGTENHSAGHHQRRSEALVRGLRRRARESAKVQAAQP